MTQFLILGKDLPNANRVQGDIIAAHKRTHKFSIDEDKRQFLAAGNPSNMWPSLYLIIEIANSPRKLRTRIYDKHIRRANILETQAEAPDEEDRIVEIGPDRWRFNLSQFPATAREMLLRTGFLSVPYERSTMNQYISDRQGNDQFDSDVFIRK